MKRTIVKRKRAYYRRIKGKRKRVKPHKQRYKKSMSSLKSTFVKNLPRYGYERGTKYGIKAGTISEHPGTQVFGFNIQTAQEERETKTTEKEAKKTFGMGLHSDKVKKILKPVEIKDPYALAYIRSLDEAEETYGQEGVASQISYILNNLRTTKGPEARKAKEELKKLQEELD